jgi:hypothetical protein
MAARMKLELESFINTGLQEGWDGWPAKMMRIERHELYAYAPDQGNQYRSEGQIQENKPEFFVLNDHLA